MRCVQHTLESDEALLATIFCNEEPTSSRYSKSVPYESKMTFIIVVLHCLKQLFLNNRAFSMVSYGYGLHLVHTLHWILHSFTLRIP